MRKLVIVGCVTFAVVAVLGLMVWFMFGVPIFVFGFNGVVRAGDWTACCSISGKGMVPPKPSGTYAVT